MKLHNVKKLRGWLLIFKPPMHAYSNSTNKPREQITAYLGAYFFLWNPNDRPDSVALDSSASFSKDFKSRLGKFSANAVISPRFPGLGIINITEIGRASNPRPFEWGWIPLLGIGHDEEIDSKGKADADVRSLHNIAGLNLAFRYSVVQVNLDGSYQKEFIDRKRTFLEATPSISIFLDARERASINFSVERKWKPSTETAWHVSFGLKL